MIWYARQSNKLIRKSCGAQNSRPDALKAGTRVFWEMICHEAVNFSGPQLPPEVPTRKRNLLA
jgi:hypothetical protein